MTPGSPAAGVPTSCGAAAQPQPHRHRTLPEAAQLVRRPQPLVHASCTLPALGHSSPHMIPAAWPPVIHSSDFSCSLAHMTNTKATFFLTYKQAMICTSIDSWQDCIPKPGNSKRVEYLHCCSAISRLIRGLPGAVSAASRSAHRGQDGLGTATAPSWGSVCGSGPSPIGWPHRYSPHACPRTHMPSSSKPDAHLDHLQILARITVKFPNCNCHCRA